MKVIIYNLNSFGGNYEYAKALFAAYTKEERVDSCFLLMPENADTPANTHIVKILCKDIINTRNKLYRKLYFVYRSFRNPFLLYKFLRKQSECVVLFNDYDQLSSFFWYPLLHGLNKHLYGIILHDPGRENYLPTRFLSNITMHWVMRLMSIAFHHGYLPERKFYNSSCQKVAIPHGIYESSDTNSLLQKNLRQKAGTHCMVGILGNIRPEKNYELIMDAVSDIDNITLLVAGRPANINISIDHYKAYARFKKIDDRVIWLDQYLAQADFNAAIAACDIILLYYKNSFLSQSGILNSVAPFKKKLIVSDTQSSLTLTARKYKIAAIIPGNNVEALRDTIRSLCASGNNHEINWENYIRDSSWQQHVSIAISAFEKITE